MRKVVALLALLLTVPRHGRAQVADSIRKGEAAYAASNVELARSIFSQILAGKMQVSSDDRVTAYKYLGAYWALQQGRADSAGGYFVPMLDIDPFATLDQHDFAQDEQNAFNKARIQIFKVGIKDIAGKTVLNPQSTDPKEKNYTFRIASTHMASIEATLVNLRADQTQGTETFPTISRNDGARDIQWNGLINTQLADSGTYELRLVATDQLKSGQPYTTTLKFKIDHVFAPLETPLPPFVDVKTGGTDTLTSRLSGFVPLLDGTKGMFIAGFAASLPFIALSERTRMSSWTSHFGAGIALGLTSGTIAAWWGATHRDDAAAKAENARRVGLRAKYNADVDARNKDRIAKTILIIRPVGG